MKTIKVKIRNILKSNIKDFIFKSKMVKADIFELKRKIKFIKKQRRHTKNFYQNFFNFFI